jgi:hypothetical protein
VFIAEQVVQSASVYMQGMRSKADYGLLDFQALLRVLDRTGVKYRH